jgi:hypothetical protein
MDGTCYIASLVRITKIVEATNKMDVALKQQAQLLLFIEPCCITKLRPQGNIDIAPKFLKSDTDVLQSNGHWVGQCLIHKLQHICNRQLTGLEETIIETPLLIACVVVE